jgi:hypothetical protein
LLTVRTLEITENRRRTMEPHLVHPWLAAQALNAFRTTSTILWLVKTLPPHIAAVLEGLSSDFGGMMTVGGFYWSTLSFTGEDNERTFEGNQTARVQRDVDVEHAPHTVNNGSVHDRHGGVEVAADFAACAIKVEYGGARTFIDGHFEVNLFLHPGVFQCSVMCKPRRV